MRDYCATVGNVVSVDVQSHADTGRSKGWALVTYSTAEEAAYAIAQVSASTNVCFASSGVVDVNAHCTHDAHATVAPLPHGYKPTLTPAPAHCEQLHGREFNDRPLNVRADRSNVEQMGGTLVFVGNLPWSTTNDQLLELFGQFTPFDVNVKTTMNGRSRGFGIVRFDTPERAEMAINSMQGFVFEGRTLDVRIDRPLTDRRSKRPATEERGVDEAQEPTNTLFVTNLDWK